MRVRSVFLVAIATCICAMQTLTGHSNEQHELELENRTFAGNVVEDGVQFSISMPYTVLFRDEIPRVIYVFRNTSESPVDVGRQFLGVKEQKIYDPRPQSRLWFQFSDGHNLSVETNSQVGRNWHAIKDGFDERDLLGPNQSALMMGEYRQGFDRYYEGGYDHVRALYMVGDGEYIASNWISIEVLSEDIASGAEMFEVDYGSEVGYKAPIYLKSLHDERWIFIHRNRISKIPKGATPRFEMDKETAVLSVYFDGVDYEPVIHNVRMIKTLSGPRELVPHYYAVGDIEAALLSANSERVPAPEAVNGAQEPSMPTSVGEESGEQASNGWLWSIGLVVVIVGVAWWRVLIRRN